MRNKVIFHKMSRTLHSIISHETKKRKCYDLGLEMGLFRGTFKNVHC